MSKSKKVNTLAPVDAVALAAVALEDFTRESIAARIANFLAVADKYDAQGEHKEAHDSRSTAKQWADVNRSLSSSFFVDVAALVDKGIIAESTLRDCFNVSDAPVYGFEKLTGTLRAIARGDITGSAISALHYGFLLAMGDDYTSNDDACKTIARVAICSVTGTAPTQRSSSAWAMGKLGIIESEKRGRSGASRFTDSAIARALREAMGTPRDVQKGASL